MAKKRGAGDFTDRIFGGMEESEEDAQPAEGQAAEGRGSKGWRDPRDWRKVAEKYGKPTTYRLPEELGDAVRARAEAEGLGISELVEVLLRHGLSDLEAGRLDLPEGD